MQADLLCIGNELLTGLSENSNAGYLSRRLWESGIAVREQRIVPDDREAICSSLEHALKHSDLVICTGGLGPTDDDLTREAVAEMLGRPLILDEAYLEKLERFFAGRGHPMPASNRKQAMVIEKSITLHNPLGTAPGALIDTGAQYILLLPGPPLEMQPMFEKTALPLLMARLGTETVYMVKTLKSIGIGESLLEAKIKKSGEPAGYQLSLAARGLEVVLQLKVRGKRLEVQDILEKGASRLRRILGAAIYGEGDQTLSGAVAEQLERKGLTITLAESCSGGLLADTLTDIPGCSGFFLASLVTYSEESKVNCLDMDADLLKREGAVSEAVAVAMAAGARRVTGADLAVSVTGIAGPESDRSGRPVGLVYIAVAKDDNICCRQLNLRGTRRAIKERTVQVALSMLWHILSGEDAD